MTASPEEFSGERLQIAREFRALTQKELADRVAASHVLVSYYEGGKRRNPAPDLVEAFGNVLGFRPAFFFDNQLSIHDWQCNFRHRRSATERVKRKVRAHAWIIGLIIGRLQKVISFPDFKVPRIAAVTNEDIETAADECRRLWDLGLDSPIDNITRSLERAGVFIAADVVETQKIDAFSGCGAVSVIFVNQSIESSSRFNFDIAHETGHMVIHHGTVTGSKETELAADRFASCLLLPRSAFTREFRLEPFSWTHIWALKKRWKVSAAAIIRRAYDLQLMGAETYRSTQKYLSFKGWRSSAEPYEPSLAQPELLPNALKYLLDQSPQSLRDISDFLGIPSSTFKELISIELPMDPRVVQFPLISN